MKKNEYKVETFLFILIGAFIEAIGLEMFVVPNNLVDGGTIGISIMLNYLTHINLGVLIVALNSIFVFMALKHLGKKFVVQTIYATAMLGLSVNYLHGHCRIPTDDLLLATVFGGSCEPNTVSTTTIIHSTTEAAMPAACLYYH